MDWIIMYAYFSNRAIGTSYISKRAASAMDFRTIGIMNFVLDAALLGTP